ncbi:transcriptional regulator [Candidatus Saccharibacteria bacterium]|nr:transcriptional regulator [Candidatus Saccharibacteria bacterium]
MEQLFGSKTRVKLLKLFMSNPNRSFYVREITRKIEEQINSVRRELANLLSLGVITSDSTDNKLYYEVNQKWEHYPALRELFTGKRAKATTSIRAAADKKDEKAASEVEAVVEEEKTVKPSVDAKVWDKVGNIAGLVYSGVLTRDDKSPVDVMIVGDVPISRAEGAVAELEKQEGKELRYAVMELDEWKYRRTVNDKFWLQVMAAKKQVVVDTQDLFVEK